MMFSQAITMPTSTFPPTYKPMRITDKTAKWFIIIYTIAIIILMILLW